MSRNTSTGNWVAGIVVVAIAVVVGVFVVRSLRHPAVPPPAAAPATAATAAKPAHYPIAQASSGPAPAGTAPLPALGGSDASVIAALAALAGGQDVHGLLVDSDLIPRIVATVDALPRHDLGRNILPAHTPRGTFVTTDADGRTVMAAANYARYAPYMQALEHVDPAALVAWYARWYPLFQQAYKDLGYPNAYFNDRLMVAIDDLLATPDLAGPPALMRVKDHYEYVDPALQARSTGQRMLLRSGPANEHRIKLALRAIRADLTGQKLPAAPASAPSPATTSG